MSSEVIQNRVAKSGLITFDLEELHPGEILPLDIKPFLFQEMILKEKDFREKIDAFEWSGYQNKTVAIFCSVEAIIPNWAYMLLTLKLESVHATPLMGTLDIVLDQYFKDKIDRLDITPFSDQRVIIKGCSDNKIPSSAYAYITHKLLPVVKSLMYGEACSNVPIYKKKKS